MRRNETMKIRKAVLFVEQETSYLLLVISFNVTIEMTVLLEIGKSRA